MSKEKLFPVKFLGAFTRDFPPPTKVEFCFLGRSNSGKSSLIKALVQNPSVVKVSAKPGHTQTINFFEAKHHYLVDLPGYGYAKLSQSQRDFLSNLLLHYLQSPRPRRAAFIIQDIRRPLTEEELKLATFVRSQGIPPVLVLNKLDKTNQKEKHKLLKQHKQWESNFHFILPLSARTGVGLEALLTFLHSSGLKK